MPKKFKVTIGEISPKPQNSLLNAIKTLGFILLIMGFIVVLGLAVLAMMIFWLWQKFFKRDENQEETIKPEMIFQSEKLVLYRSLEMRRMDEFDDEEIFQIHSQPEIPELADYTFSDFYYPCFGGLLLQVEHGKIETESRIIFLDEPENKIEIIYEGDYFEPRVVLEDSKVILSDVCLKITLESIESK